MKHPRSVILAPVVSEKSYELIEAHNQYTFIVDRRAYKPEIAQAVGAIFGVDVVSVNTMRRRGKQKRTGWIFGRRADQKRAVVTLAPGDSIDIFGV